MSGRQRVSTRLLQGWLEIPKRKVSSTLQFFRLRGYPDTAPTRLSAFQLVSRHAPTSELGRRLANLTPESCVSLKVKETLRPASARREREGEAGLYDYEIEDVQVLNRASSLPFLPNCEEGVDGAVRAQHRHIELRSNALQSNLRERARIKSELRRVLEEMHFLEVETPLLFKSTPEGAREFLVPTRKKGHFFALPQSPQQYKQILMAGGVHRYYQFAKCFRDEGGRADRQLEFTQLDMEMAFVTVEDVMAAIARIVLAVDKDGTLFDVKDGVIPRMRYMDVMRRYGSDKPDLRFNLAITSIEDDEIEGTIDMLQFVLPQDKTWSNKRTNDVRKMMEEYGVEASFHSSTKSSVSPLYKLVSSHVPQTEEQTLTLLARRARALSGGATSMGQARLRLQTHLESLDLVAPRSTRPFKLCWITDFPLFSPSTTSEPGQGGTSGLSSTHHPFTAPHPDDLSLLDPASQHDDTDRLTAIRGLHYDLVMNGAEIGGGSIRIHDRATQETIFRVLGMSDERKGDFTHLLRVLGSGCPPHGGFALGLDRFIAMLCDAPSIRHVIAFPKTGSGVDALIGAPSVVPDDTLAEYHISIRDKQT